MGLLQSQDINVEESFHRKMACRAGARRPRIARLRTVEHRRGSFRFSPALRAKAGVTRCRPVPGPPSRFALRRGSLRFVAALRAKTGGGGS